MNWGRYIVIYDITGLLQTGLSRPCGQGVGGVTDTNTGSVDLNVISQSEHQTYITEENKEVR